MKDLRRFWIIFKCVSYTLYKLIGFLVLKYQGKLSKEVVAQYCQNWSRRLLGFAKIELKVTGAAPLDRPGLLVGNHVSYIDIPAVLSVMYAVFVSKKEVAYWPVFGQAATAVGTIFVNRDSAESRRNVALTLSRAVEENSRCICLFPEGTSSLWGKNWKKGSFQIAERFEFPVQAFALKYKPIWDAAYIDDDTLITHLWRLLGHEKIEVEIEFKEPIFIKDSVVDTQELQKWVQARVSQFLDLQGFPREVTGRDSAELFKESLA